MHRQRDLWDLFRFGVEGRLGRPERRDSLIYHWQRCSHHLGALGVKLWRGDYEQYDEAGPQHAILRGDVDAFDNLVGVETVALRVGLVIESTTTTRKVTHEPTRTIFPTGTRILSG